jgi:hypothetical protein
VKGWIQKKVRHHKTFKKNKDGSFQLQVILSGLIWSHEKNHTEAIGRSERTGVLSKEVILGKLDANPEKGDCGGL